MTEHEREYSICLWHYIVEYDSRLYQQRGFGMITTERALKCAEWKVEKSHPLASDDFWQQLAELRRIREEIKDALVKLQQQGREVPPQILTDLYALKRREMALMDSACPLE